LIGRSGVSSGTSGILLAARSAMKKWRSARDSGVCIRPLNSSSSFASPASKDMVVAPATASSAFIGAGKGPAMPRTMLRANCRKASGAGA
jgi:hypothetical protein